MFYNQDWHHESFSSVVQDIGFAHQSTASAQATELHTTGHRQVANYHHKVANSRSSTRILQLYDNKACIANGERINIRHNTVSNFAVTTAIVLQIFVRN